MPPDLDLMPKGAMEPVAAYIRECTKPTDRFFEPWFAGELYFFSGRGFAAGLPVVFGDHWSEIPFQRRALRILEHESVPIILREDSDLEEHVQIHLDVCVAALRPRPYDPARSVPRSADLGEARAPDDAYVRQAWLTLLRALSTRSLEFSPHGREASPLTADERTSPESRRLQGNPGCSNTSGRTASRLECDRQSTCARRARFPARTCCG